MSCLHMPGRLHLHLSMHSPSTHTPCTHKHTGDTNKMKCGRQHLMSASACTHVYKGTYIYTHTHRFYQSFPVKYVFQFIIHYFEEKAWEPSQDLNEGRNSRNSK